MPVTSQPKSHSRSHAKSRSRGFTIIEVILVMAIAGLIFVVVFLAVRNAQVAARDAQRKQDASQFFAAAQQWRTSHGGRSVNSNSQLQEVKNQYFQNHNNPVTGQPYDIVYYPHSTWHSHVPPPDEGEMIYVVAHICGSDDSEETLITGSDFHNHGSWQFALLAPLENGVIYCLDNE